MPDDNSGSATVRDVYELVSKSNQELGEKIDELGDKLSRRIDALTESYGPRITVLESVQSAQAVRLDKVESGLGTLTADHAAAKGSLVTIKWLLGGACLIGATFAGIFLPSVV
jgi:hypothetical protein